MLRPYRLTYPVAAATLIAGASGSAGHGTTRVLGSPAAEIASIVEGVIAEQRLVGTQAAVWHAGKLVLRRSWGTADLALGVPVTDSTRFLIASITKPITALAIRRLAAAGRLDLDAPVQTVVPEFPPKPGPPITARLLLDHRGGIRHYRRGETNDAGFFDRHYPTALAALEKFAGDDLVARPGEREQYSSFGYTLLAAMVEKASGEPFGQHLRTTVFAPLGMTATEAPDWRYPVPGLGPSYGFFLPHLGATTERPFQARRLDFSYNAGGGNLVSTSSDLVRLGRAFLRDGAAGEVAAELLSASQLPGSWWGWHVERDSAGRVLMHATGASEAYQGGITIWPEHDLVVVALSNTWGIDSRRGGFTLTMHRAIADVVLR